MIDLHKLSFDDAVKKAMEMFAFTKSDAELYVAIITGEVEGDVVAYTGDDSLGAEPPVRMGR